MPPLPEAIASAGEVEKASGVVVAVGLVAVDPQHPALLYCQPRAGSVAAVNRRTAGTRGGADVDVVLGRQSVGARGGRAEVADREVLGAHAAVCAPAQLEVALPAAVAGQRGEVADGDVHRLDPHSRRHHGRRRVRDGGGSRPASRRRERRS